MQQDNTRPITKEQSRRINDRIASFDRYRHRLRIDQRLQDRRLKRKLAEVWDD